MTVQARIPIERYTGNGVITRFDWDWEMMGDSAIGVLVNNEYVDGWRWEGNSVVFDVAPVGEVVIYRRTPLHQLLDFTAFGRFQADKTERGMDRAIMITQELWGEAEPGEGMMGIVGNANLYGQRDEFSFTVISEKGTDAVLEMWVDDDVTPQPPDPTILWGGDPVMSNTVSTSEGATYVYFFMDGYFQYSVNNEGLLGQWVDAPVTDGQYWMRVVDTGQMNQDTKISDGVAYRSEGEVFPINDSGTGVGPFIELGTYGLTPPVTVASVVRVDICKDSGGIPDGNWAERLVILEAMYNA